MKSLLATVSLIAFLLLALVHSQQPTFRSSTTYVEVDAYVSNGRGEFVKDLNMDDFEILEDGRLQTISTYSFVDLPIFSPPLRSSIRSLESDVTTNARSDEGRLWVMLLDGASGEVPALRALNVARQFIEEAFGPNDLMAVIHVQGTMKASQSLTRSKSLLLDSLERFRTDGASAAPRSELTRILDAYRVVEEVSHSLGALGLRGRRKAVLWVGPSLIFNPGLTRNGAAIVAAYGDMVRAAQRNNVAIYPIARSPSLGVGMAGREAYRGLAEDTGGRAVIGTNDLSRAFADIVRENSSYYVLGFYPTNEHRDGKFHEITVRVKRPGVTVRTRKGYLAPDADSANREATAATLRPGAEIRDALRNPIPRTGLEVSLSAVPFKGSGTAGSVLLAAHVRGHDPLRPDQSVDIAYRALDAEGKTLVERGTQYTLQARGEQKGLRFVDRLALPRGRHEIRFAAHLNDGRTGSVVAYVDVADFTAGRMALSGLTIETNAPAESALFTGADAVPGDAAVTTVRRFTPAANVIVRGVLYADADVSGGMLAFAATVRRDDGTTVRDGLNVMVDKTGAPQGQYPLVVELPLSDLRPGGYVFTLDARLIRGRRSAVTRQVPFWVVQE